tara:strand:+ start:114 stop:305 length:192 start_codon:yes stop_codon:yes gene_type:complete
MTKIEIKKALKLCRAVYGSVSMVQGADPITLELKKVDVFYHIDRQPEDAKFEAIVNGCCLYID